MRTGRAYVVDRQGERFHSEIREIGVNELPQGELLVAVSHSSVNYKDALACSPNGNIVRAYPFVPGIDLAGVVVASEDPRFLAGDAVIATGYELGVSRYGGFGELARIPADWAIPLPQGLTAEEAMALGTAGLTAALSMWRLIEAGVNIEGGPVLVTGASGGVGSMAVAILAQLGYEVAASTGKVDMAEVLLDYGARRVIGRAEVGGDPPRPLGKQLWAGAVDSVGGGTLASLLSCTKYGGAVAACGLTGGSGLATTVLPFILRGVSLLGIDSVYMDHALRVTLWDKLASDWKPAKLERMYKRITLSQLDDAVGILLKGEARGRFVLAMDTKS